MQDVYHLDPSNVIDRNMPYVSKRHSEVVLTMQKWLTFPCLDRHRGVILRE